jgi:hypothetical protein
MTEEERTKVLDLRIDVGSTLTAIAWLGFLWIALYRFSQLFLHHVDPVIYGVHLAHLPTLQATLAAVALGVLTWVVLRIRHINKSRKKAHGIVEVVTIETRAVVAVDDGEWNPELETEVIFDPDSPLNWYIFDIDNGQLLCVGPLIVSTLKDAGATPFPSSRVQIVRMPDHSQILSAACAGNLLEPMRCRPAFRKDEYNPGESCFEIISGTLETLDEDLRRVKAQGGKAVTHV